MRMAAPSTLLVLLISGSSGAQDAAARRDGPGPAWAPRAVFAGLSSNTGALTPQLRLQWQWPFVHQSGDALALLVELGGGHAVAHPELTGERADQRMTLLYQYTAQAGLAVRSRREGPFLWGLHAAAGPVLYGARYQAHPKEQRLGLLWDGRLRAGLRLGRICAGAEVGYGSLGEQPLRSAAAPHVGGLMAGLYLDLWQ
jgi:hypothetical protein